MKKFNVVVIGAGIQGLSCAYHLSKNEGVSVAVIETESGYGMGSSSRSGSMIMKSRENREKVELSLHSFLFFENFEEYFGEKLKFRETGFLSLVNNDYAEGYKKEHDLRLELGVPSRILDQNAILKMSPGVNISDIEFGVYCGDDGEVDAYQIMDCYEREARSNGTTFFYNEVAQGIDVKNGAVAGIYSDRGYLECDFVVNAAGVNAGEVSSWIGEVIPLDNRRRSIFFTKTNSKKFLSGPMVEDAELQWYYRGLKDGQVLIGMGLEVTSEVTDEPNYGFLSEIRRATEIRAPELADFEVITGHSGIRPITPDILPVIGPSSSVENYIYSCGWGGEGIMHSPSAGVIVSDWITGSNNYIFDANKFLPSRFTE